MVKEINVAYISPNYIVVVTLDQGSIAIDLLKENKDFIMY